MTVREPDCDHETDSSTCPTCSPDGGQPPKRSGKRLSTVRIRARNEESRIVQVAGNLFVCSRANGNCCCGWEEKDRMPFDNSLWADEWERRKIRNKVHLSFTGCLGPCAIGNNALLQLYGRSIWFKDLNDPSFAPAVFDYIESMLDAGNLVEPPEWLRDHVYARYLPGPTDGSVSIVEPIEAGDDDGLEGLDPVCLMDVNPETARHKIEHEGRAVV